MSEIKKLLKQGKIIVYPTDTAYAIGGDLLNPKTRAKVNQIKQRDRSKILPAIANSLAMIKRYCLINRQEELLAKKYWPGPLTIVLRVKEKYQKILGATLAIRVPNNEIARFLSKELGNPLISTSANFSGKPTCYNIKNVLKQLQLAGKKIDAIVDVGQLPKSPVSTIVQVSDGSVEVLRKGAVVVK